MRKENYYAIQSFCNETDLSILEKLDIDGLIMVGTPAMEVMALKRITPMVYQNRFSAGKLRINSKV